MRVRASEQNAIYYVEMLESGSNTTVNEHVAGGSGLIPAENYMVKNLGEGCIDPAC